MTVLAELKVLSSAGSAMDRLKQFLAQQGTKRQPSEDFEQFEHQLHEDFMAAEREVLATELHRIQFETLSFLR